MCYCKDTAVPRCATEDVRKTRKKQKYNPYISPLRVSLEKKLPSAHQAWIISISWRKLQNHNIPTNWAAGKNTLAFIASVAPCAVQSCTWGLSYGWLPLQSMQHSISPHARCTGMLWCRLGCLPAHRVWAVQQRAARQLCRKMTERRQNRLHSCSGGCCFRTIYMCPL